MTPTDPHAPDVASNDGARNDVASNDSADHDLWGLGHPFVVVPLAGIALAAAVARFVVGSALWRQEATAVNLARLPLGQLGDALRHEGSPPLSFVLLHGWISVFGHGDHAVRAFSGVVSLLALPLAYLLGRRIGGRRVGALTVIALSLSPYFLRIGSEAGMYSMLVVLALAGYLLVVDALERPEPWRLLAVAVLTGALLWTHYWSMYLVAATLGLLGVQLWRDRSRSSSRPTLLVLGAVAAGCVLFVPWLPSFVTQVRHVGTPWGRAFRPATLLVTSVMEFNGGPQLLMFLAVVLVTLGVFGRGVDDWHLELDFRTRIDARRPALVLVTTLLVAGAVGAITRTAFEPGYAAVYFPFFVVLVVLGLDHFAGPVARNVVFVVFGVLSVVGLVTVFTTDRTEARVVARAIVAAHTDGGLVLVCPDQVGPSVERVVPNTFEIESWPRLGPAGLVDWDDYAGQVRRADPAKIAATALARAGDRTIFVVMAANYPSVGARCGPFLDALTAARPGRLLVDADLEEYLEPMSVYELPPRSG